MKRRKVEMLDDTSMVLMGVDVDKIYETLLSLKSVSVFLVLKF